MGQHFAVALISTSSLILACQGEDLWITDPPGVDQSPVPVLEVPWVSTDGFQDRLGAEHFSELVMLSDCEALRPNDFAVGDQVDSRGRPIELARTMDQDKLPTEPTRYQHVDVIHHGARAGAETNGGRKHQLQAACGLNFCLRRPDEPVVVGSVRFDQRDPGCAFFYRIVRDDWVEVRVNVLGSGSLTFDADFRQGETICSTGYCTRRMVVGSPTLVKFEPYVGGEPPVFEPTASHGCEVNEVDETSALIVADRAQSICTFQFPKGPDRRDVLLDVAVGGQVEVATPSETLGACDGTQGSKTCGFQVSWTDRLEFIASASEFLPRWGGDCVPEPDNAWRAAIGADVRDSRCSFQLANPAPPDCESIYPPRIVVSSNGMEPTLLDGLLEIPAPDPAVVTLIAEADVVPPAAYRWREEVGGVWRHLGDGEVLEAQMLSCERFIFCTLELTVEDDCGRRTTTARYVLGSDR